MKMKKKSFYLHSGNSQAHQVKLRDIKDSFTQSSLYECDHATLRR